MKRIMYIFMVFLTVTTVTVAEAREMIIVSTEEWPPFNFTMENGEVGGIATKIVKAALNEAGVDYKIEVYPWARAVYMTMKNPNVMIYTIFRSEQREKKFQWICPITPPNYYYFYRLKTRTDITVESLEDAKKYMTGVMRNDMSHEFLVKNGFKEKKQLEVVSREELNIKMLFKARNDLIVQSEFSLLERMKKLGLSYDKLEKVFLAYKGNAESNCMAFGLKTPKSLVEKIRKALEKVTAEGAVDSAMKDYLEGK